MLHSMQGDPIARRLADHADVRSLRIVKISQWGRRGALRPAARCLGGGRASRGIKAGAFLLPWIAVLCASPAASAEPPTERRWWEPPEDALWTAHAHTTLLFGVDDAGSGLLVGGGLSRAVVPNLSVGAELSAVIGVINHDRDCDPGEQCSYYYHDSLVPFAELHASRSWVFDPWLRAGLGPALVFDSDWDSDAPQLALLGSASAGFDVRISHVFVGGFGTANLVTGPQPSSTGFGVRLGAQR